jgi:hypothetical protein
MAGGWRQPPIPAVAGAWLRQFSLRKSACYDGPCRQAAMLASKRIGTMTDTIKNPEQAGEDLLTFEIADEALEAAAEKAKPAFTLIGSPTVSVLVACCG